MRYLLDTHTFFWFINDSDQLSNQAKELIESDVNLWLSIASLWEIAIKNNLGKLTLPKPYEEFLNEQITINEVEILSISLSHLAQLTILPLHHRDPFDRLLIVQAIVEKVSIISKDSTFDNYPIKRLW